jgi:hypothetical protein
MGSATPVQVWTLIAASISAVGSSTVGLSTYAKFRHDSIRPLLVVSWTQDDLGLAIRNRSTTARTAYAVGLQWHRKFTVVRAIEFGSPERFGVSLPLLLEPGQQAKWRLPYSQVVYAYQKCPRFLRRSFRIFVDLGDSRYCSFVPREARRNMRRVEPVAQDAFDGLNTEGPTEIHPGYM